MASNTLRKCLKCGYALKDGGKPAELAEAQPQTLEATPNAGWQCQRCLEHQQQLEQCLRQHEKRLQLLEEGLAGREWELQGRRKRRARNSLECWFAPKYLLFVSYCFSCISLISGSKLDASCESATVCPFLPHTISRKAIIITAVFVVLTILLAVILSLTTNLFGKTLKTSKIGEGDDTRQNIPINSTIGTVSSSF